MMSGEVRLHHERLYPNIWFTPFAALGPYALGPLSKLKPLERNPL